MKGYRVYWTQSDSSTDFYNEKRVSYVEHITDCAHFGLTNIEKVEHIDITVISSNVDMNEIKKAIKLKQADDDERRRREKIDRLEKELAELKCKN